LAKEEDYMGEVLVNWIVTFLKCDDKDGFGYGGSSGEYLMETAKHI